MNHLKVSYKCRHAFPLSTVVLFPVSILPYSHNQYLHNSILRIIHALLSPVTPRMPFTTICFTYLSSS
jgi:hypothetical protein